MNGFEPLRPQGLRFRPLPSSLPARSGLEVQAHLRVPPASPCPSLRPFRPRPTARPLRPTSSDTRTRMRMRSARPWPMRRSRKPPGSRTTSCADRRSEYSRGGPPPRCDQSTSRMSTLRATGHRGCRRGRHRRRPRRAGWRSRPMPHRPIGPRHARKDSAKTVRDGGFTRPFLVRRDRALVAASTGRGPAGASPGRKTGGATRSRAPPEGVRRTMLTPPSTRRRQNVRPMRPAHG